MSQLRNRILIFGHQGYLGSSIQSRLLADDILVYNNINEITKEIISKIDVFINCAGASNVSASFIDPSIDFHKNATLVQLLLEKIRLSGNQNIRFINFSSAAVYGSPKNLPINENSITNPISPYGFHKMIAERICSEYSKFFGLNTLSLRIFSAYGLGQRKMLLWDLHQKILNSDGKIILFGTGEESRDFIHIDDIVQQIVLAIDNADFKGEAINVANGLEVRIRDIVEMYKKIHSIPFKYSFNGLNRPGDPLNWCADISKMNDWGYSQAVSIQNGVESYIKWAIANK
jgi:dTDP-glucose 4,6-dehydratase/UDP-glucose 4-epimerase